MKFSSSLEQYRVTEGEFATHSGEPFGKFFIPGPHGRTLQVIASNGDAELGVNWEHVSVSTPSRCPNWPEMCFVKSLFWDEEECVMQVHPPRSKWINNHPFCLHMWRPLNDHIPLPPEVAV